MNPKSLNIIPGAIKFLIEPSSLRIISFAVLPNGSIPIASFIFFDISCTCLSFIVLFNDFEIPPILLPIDISLLFTITIKLLGICEILFIASSARPPVIAPSPITATTKFFEL